MANSGWRIGFSIHPRWFDGSDLATFLRPLKKAGLSSLEVELDDHLDCWAAIPPLINSAVEQGVALTFHAPYRHPHSIMGFSGTQRKRIEQDQRPLLQIAQTWAESLDCQSPVVFHAAMSPVAYPADALVADTIAFLQWVCVTLPNLRIALENNHPPHRQEVKIGIEYGDVLAIVDQLDASRVGICWDMGHDHLRGSDQQPPSGWLKRVVHVHVHDVDEHGLDHYPLVFGRVPVAHWLRTLRKVQEVGTVVLELKGERMKNWSSTRVQDSLTGSIALIAGELG